MKIAQILPHLDVGGVETGTVDLAKALKKRGDQPYVISNGGVLVEELVKAGIPHLKLPVHQKSITSLRLVREIADFLERERIDIIHARSRVPAWLAYLAVRRTNCDFVTTCHGYYSKHFLSRVMGWGKKVIAISHSIGRRMIDDFGVPPERIALIHRGVDLSRYPFVQTKYDRPKSGPFKIINVGRITPIKGHQEFIRAVHLLSRRFQNFEVSIVGAADDDKASYFRDLKIMVQRLGLNSQVKFLGTRRDIPELLKEADLLVLSSKIPEAFGRVLIEAGACGTAVIASRIGGILDVVNDNENGLLFSPENFEEMAVAMERLLRDRALAKKFSSNLRQKVEREFSLDRMVEKTCQVYDEVKHQKRILVTKLGAVGDLVLAVPSFRMLRKRFPSANISLLVESKLIQLVERCPYLDEIIVFDRSNQKDQWRRLLILGKRLKQRGFDISIDLQNNWKTHLLAFLARIPKRYGYKRGSAGFLLTHPITFWDQSLGPIEHQFQVLKRAGVVHFEDAIELWPGAEEEASIGARLKQAGRDSAKRLVGFILGSSPNWPTKQWPIERFVELSKNLLQRFDCQIALIGTKEDEKLAQSFNPLNSKHIFDFTGKTSLGELASLVKHLDVILTGDTAPLHIASAFETKIVALFGPTEPKRHMPPGKDHIALVKRIPCQPCYSGTCKNSEKLLCMREISVSEVVDAVSRQLEQCSAALGTTH
ncbi:MAG: lipopolysaccharide heptosyltransferase II [Omnitrophica bacterium RIFCSPHIGHO2_02_FULL_46_11]|nr:MAG: lipopolysaccharide heptosyltransferase II [Omnitrophica bacterium RIFCSPHIGHO2_02_FULL_46_11]OGW87639.1 MAG: lipopolysaccharide heptosyltransferase II [Omnitrophica bacterium RIFCSPLOWO2_01_FULL_45_10b]